MNSSTLAKPIEVLLVEDNPGDVDLTIESLDDAKVCNRIHVATDGAKAIEFLDQRGAYETAPRPDLVLLDLNLPKLDGRAVLRHAKESPRLQQIPVVVLTSSAAEADVLRSYELGANAYVTKPVDLEQFVRIVQSIESFWFSVVRLPPAAEG